MKRAREDRAREANSSSQSSSSKRWRRRPESKLGRAGNRQLNKTFSTWRRRILASGFATWKGNAQDSYEAPPAAASSSAHMTPGLLQSSSGVHQKLRERLVTSSQLIATTTPVDEDTEYFVYLHVRLMYIGEIDLKSQSFGARFDLHVTWDPKNLPPGTSDDFAPIIRFPEAMTWTEIQRVDIAGDFGGELAGFRAMIEGRFRTPMELSMFPFDAQALKIEMQLGRERASGAQLLYRDGWRMAHHPTEPNVMVNQVEAGVKFRPLRYSLSLTGTLESRNTMCKYTIWVPTERDASHYVLNHYFFGILVSILGCTVPFNINVDDISGRLTMLVELYLLIVTYKYAVSGELPVLPYNTALDRYLLYSFIFITIALEGIGFCNSQADSDRLQLVLIVISVCAHLYFAIEVCVSVQSRLQCISKHGKIDENMCALMQQNGIELNAEGLVTDPEKYRRLLEGQTISEE